VLPPDPFLLGAVPPDPQEGERKGGKGRAGGSGQRKGKEKGRGMGDGRGNGGGEGKKGGGRDERGRDRGGGRRCNHYSKQKSAPIGLGKGLIIYTVPEVVNSHKVQISCERNWFSLGTWKAFHRNP
jgi:hypothetical protein